MTTTTLTFGQAAARLGVDVHTIRRWARSEHIPTIRVGHATRIPVAAVDELLAAGWTL